MYFFFTNPINNNRKKIKTAKKFKNFPKFHTLFNYSSTVSFYFIILKISIEEHIIRCISKSNTFLEIKGLQLKQQINK